MEGTCASAEVLASEMMVKRVNIDDYEKYFRDVLSLPTAQINKINSQVCEERSGEMARYSHALAVSERARVVYMSFGAVHAHGVIKQLQAYSASMIVFSPNLPSDTAVGR